MKILVIVDSINIEDSSGSKANVALINNLQQAGFEVLVYHYTLKNVVLKNVECYAIPEIKFSICYLLSRIQRIFARKFNINVAPFFQGIFGFSFTFFNDTKSIIKALKKVAFKPDFVLTLSKGGSFRPHYAVLKLPEMHNKWIAYVHDPFPSHCYPRPYDWVETNYKITENFIQNVSEKARFSAFPSLLLKDWMGSYYPNFLKTGFVIPHQNAEYVQQNTDFPDYFQAEKFNLLHAGNLLKQRSPNGLIEGFKLFLDSNPAAKSESRLILIGMANLHADALNKYESEIEQLFTYQEMIPFDVVYNLQKNTAVNVILEAKGEISPFLPAKFPHCVEADKPILLLCPFYSETRRLLGNNYPFWAEIDDVENIQQLIQNLYFDWKKSPKNCKLDRQDLVEYLSPSNLKSIFINLK
jgi:hypothetical protein